MLQTDLNCRLKQKKKVLNICQDIMSAAGNKQMPKQIGIALYILRQTRSKDLVTVLNRFGHCISYNEAQRYITAMAKQVETDRAARGVFIPSNIKPSIFTQYALDNLDFHNDSKEGYTLHSTTHNIYQFPNESDSERCVISGKVNETALGGMNKVQFNHSGLTIHDRRRKSRSIQGKYTSARPPTDSLYLGKDSVWMLLRRITCDGKSYVINWNTFNETVIDKIQNKTTIGYGPMFPQSPTNPDVVKSSIDYFLEVSDVLGQETTVVTCDQAIYDIVKVNFMAAIGKIMQGGGMEELLVECGMFKQGMAKKVMNGGDYYKMIRCHTIVGEAFFGLFWNSFEEWCYEQDEEVEQLSRVNEDISRVYDALTNQNIAKAQSDLDAATESLHKLECYIEQYIRILGPTGRYWLMYISMVMILLQYIYADRAGEWDFNLRAVENMLPYLVSAGHTKYSSCIPLYLNDMRNLREQYPEVHESFQRGEFCIRLTDGKFNGVWTDLALEQTYNKDGKNALFKGIAGEEGDSTREKYIAAAPQLTKVSETVRKMTRLSRNDERHHSSGIKKSEEERDLAQQIEITVRDKMIDPFQTQNTSLINIVNGEVATSLDILRAKEIGQEAIDSARVNELEKIVVPKVQGFDKKLVKTLNKEQNLASIYKQESSVTRALCYLKFADEETRDEAFSYEWTQCPSSLFEASTGNTVMMRKGNKCDFLLPLLDGIKLDECPSKSDRLQAVFILDAMAFVNKYRANGALRYVDLPEVYIQQIMRIAPDSCKAIHFVGDRYDYPPEKSIKSDEHLRRYKTATSEFIPSDNVPIPEFSSLLASSLSKKNLLNYFAESVCQRRKELLSDNITFVFSGTFIEEQKSIMVNADALTRVEELACENHEEADTRIVVHLAYCASNGIENVVIFCTDTDIVMLCIYHFPRLGLKKLWIQKANTFLPIHEIVNKLVRKTGDDALTVTATLLCCYVLSGCDSCSYPFRVGKKKAAAVAISIIGVIPNLCEFGCSEDIVANESHFDEARNFFVRLYSRQCEFTSLNKLRQHIFATTEKDLRSLPPTEDAFHYHVLRCLYQMIVYKRASSNILVLPDVSCFGRVFKDGKLTPITTDKPCKPPVVKVVKCKCRTTRCLKNCLCARNGVGCFVGCLCLGEINTCGRKYYLIESDSDD